MKRVDSANAAAAADTPVAHSGGNEYFSDTVPGTVVTAQFMNDVQEEIVNVITGFGGSLDGTLRNQMYTAINGAIGGSAWLIKTGAYTAVAGDKIVADTRAGAFTITLPASPTDGQEVRVKKSDPALAANTLTIGRNGNDIMDDANDLEITDDQTDFTFVWHNAESTWIY